MTEESSDSTRTRTQARWRFVLAGISCAVFVIFLVLLARAASEDPLEPLRDVRFTALGVGINFALALGSAVAFSYWRRIEWTRAHGTKAADMQSPLAIALFGSNYPTLVVLPLALGTAWLVSMLDSSRRDVEAQRVFAGVGSKGSTRDRLACQAPARRNSLCAARVAASFPSMNGASPWLSNSSLCLIQRSHSARRCRRPRSSTIMKSTTLVT